LVRTPNSSKAKPSAPSSSLFQEHLLEGSVNKKTCARRRLPVSQALINLANQQLGG
jgi:hypothetical protein